MIITHFINLQILWTSGEILAFLDLLCRNVYLQNLNGHQLANKDVPKDISFINQNGHVVQYLIDHKSSADDGNDQFYPDLCTHPGGRKLHHLKIDGIDKICTIVKVTQSPVQRFCFLPRRQKD